MMRVAMTFTPETMAASRFPPMAYMFMPSWVLLKRIHTATATTRAMIMITGILKRCPDPRAVKSDRNPPMGWELLGAMSK